MNKTIRLAVILAIGVLAMSSASIMIRLAQSEDVPSLVIAAYRLGIASVILAIPALKQHALQTYAKLNVSDILLLLSSGILLGLHFAAWISSLALTTVLASVVLVTTSPLWIGLASPLLLKERTSPQMWFGIGLAIIGGIVVALTGTTNHQGGLTLAGNALAVMGAMFVAGYLMIGRSIRQKMPLVTYIWGVYGVAALVLTIWALLTGLPFFGFSTSAYLWLFALALIPQLIGHSAANYAVRHLSAAFVGVATLAEPIGSALLAALILSEIPAFEQILGSALILIAIGLASRAERRKTKPQMPNSPHEL